MKCFQPERIYIESGAEGSLVAERARALFGSAEIVPIDHHNELAVPEPERAHSIRAAKRQLAICRKRGAAVKRCTRDPGAPARREFYILHAQNCCFDCEYCFLQYYLDHAVPTIWCDQESILESVRQAAEAGGCFHAGELCDAFALEHVSGFAARAVELFASLPQAQLELRTKSDLVDSILAARHGGNVVISWTLTPAEVVARYEGGTAALSARLAAARRCQEAGYTVGLRLDPVILYEGWQRGYAELFEQVYDRLDPARIQSCTMGVLRYHPLLERVIQARFPRSQLLRQEFAPGPDGKLRYLRPIRTAMYRTLIKELRARHPQLKIELCMEGRPVWRALRDELAG